MFGSHIRTACPDCGSALARRNFVDPKTMRQRAEVSCPDKGCDYREVFDLIRASASVSSVK